MLRCPNWAARVAHGLRCASIQASTSERFQRAVLELSGIGFGNPRVLIQSRIVVGWSGFFSPPTCVQTSSMARCLSSSAGLGEESVGGLAFTAAYAAALPAVLVVMANLG